MGEKESGKAPEENAMVGEKIKKADVKIEQELENFAGWQKR